MRRLLRNTLITASVLGVLGTSPAYVDGNGSMSQEEITRDNKEVAQLALTYLEERDSLK